MIHTGNPGDEWKTTRLRERPDDPACAGSDDISGVTECSDEDDVYCDDPAFVIPGIPADL